MKNSIFVYGTLLNDEIVDLLLKSKPTKCDAVLNDYKRVTVLGEVFPAIFPEKNSQVKGAIMTGLSDHHIDILDEYESFCYERKQVTVSLVDNTQYPCETFICKPEYKDLLSSEAWSNKNFRQKHLQPFLKQLTSEY